MSDAARRKERRRLKREKKKAEARRDHSGSPYKRIGEQGKLEACYVNADWQTSGLASIYLIRQNPQGGFAMGGFLIDLWCVGLKDAWGTLDICHDEIDSQLDRARERFELIRIEPDAARHLVAGAVRFARQNGFRLPPHFDRWINLLGEVPDISSADLRPFGKDGGLCWIGPLDDLRKRLIGSSLEDFLARPDVQFTTEDDEFDMDEEDEDSESDELDEEFDEVIDKALDEMCDNLLQLCRDRGEEPSPLLRQGAAHVMAALAMQLSATTFETSESEFVHSMPVIDFENILRAVDESPESELSDPLKDAIRQVVRVSRETPAGSQNQSPSP